MSLHGNGSNIESMLLDLKDGLEKIYSNDVSKSDYFRLYTLAYNICTSTKYGSISSDNQLYINLNCFFRGHLETEYNKCKDLIDEPLLWFYKKLWQDYRCSSKVLSGVCGYLNRYWVRFERDKGIVNVLEVYHLALVSWKDFLLDPLKERMANAVLKLIKRERNGETVNNGLILTALNSYIEMGIKISNPYSDHPSLNLYKEAFEAPFLAETELFYARESYDIIRNNSVSDFLKKIGTCFAEERKRVHLYLHETSLEPLMQILEHFLVRRHMDTFHSEFETLLEESKTEDLKRMYQILFRISGGLDQLRIQFEEYVVKEGLKAIEKHTESNVIDPKDYIHTLLDIHKQFNSILTTAFENNSVFANALDKASAKFINKNPITEMSKSSNTSAYLLAKYCDLLLKGKVSDSEEAEIVDSLNQVMLIFKYIEEKDVFECFYSQMFAKRLVQKMNASGHDDAEIIMISKLRDACGFEYTSKMQRMFQDVCVSRDLIEQFKTETDNLGIDFCINVFKSTSWPLKRSILISLPQELEKSVQEFTKFYCAFFNGRKLTWLHGISRGEVASKCFDKPYIFQASTLQIAILLQFNSQMTMSFIQLEESTGILHDILLQVLKFLTKLKLLKEAHGNNVTESSFFALNVSYRSKRIKVNIHQSIKSETRSENETVEKYVEEERKHTIQAAIVRIAKIRKVIQHDVLLSDVLNQLSSRFKPTISLIKRCIDILIEKEYLKRVEKDSYSYLA